MIVADGFAVDLAALHAAADGIRKTVAQVAVGGTGPIGAAAGHEGLARALDGFLDRWQRGVHALTEDGRALADHLAADERAYRAIDQAGSSRIGGVLHGAGPDPAAG